MGANRRRAGFRRKYLAKLKVRVPVQVALRKRAGAAAKQGGGFVLGDWRLLLWLTAVAATFSAGPAVAQGNIDAGRTPAQLFADTCAACHRSARDIRRPTVGFLRQHYTAGSDEAAA